MRARASIVSACLFALALGAHARPAAASGAASPEGRYARVASETTLLVWDAETSLEELVVRPEIETDAPTVAYVMATASDVLVTPADGAAIEAMRALMKRPAPPNELPSIAVPNVAIESLKHASLDDVTRWLREHGLRTDGPLAAWATATAAEGRTLTFVRASDPTAERHLLRFPALRFAIHTRAASLPYAEPDLDLAEHAAYLKRAGSCPTEPCRAPLTRALDIFVVSPGGVRLAPLDGGAGPSLAQLLQVSGAELPLIGGLRFDPSSRWTVAHFEDPSLEHEGPTELTFESLGGRVAEPAKRTSLGEAQRAHGRSHGTRALFALVALLALGAVGLALRQTEG